MTTLQNSNLDKGRLFEENIVLKQTVDKMKKSLDDISVVTVEDLKDFNNTSRFPCFNSRRCKVIPTLLCIIILLILAWTVAYLAVGKNTLSAKNISDIVTASSQKSAKSGDTSCSGSTKPKTFPDIDYALFGYNVIKGYPLAVGHDPGLTRPIFKSDYTDKKLTADCRYFLPKGLIIVPDISCVTSFTSTTIQDQYQLTKSLSGSAQISGGGWGAEFSASAEYRKQSSEVGSKESVYINSEAKCDYYLSMFDELQPPMLSKSFLMMAKTIKNESDVFMLFDYYGTHYLKEVTFGARLVYENKMSKSSFKSLSESSGSVSVSASYSGIVRVEGSLSLSKSEQKQASEFRSKAETRTISVGAPPPPNGSTNQWASAVKENPVPTKYKMAGIEELFTKNFMEHSGLEYEVVSKLINSSKGKYCEHLKNKGVVDSCKTIESYTKFHGVKLDSTQFSTINADERSCIKSCVGDDKCVAVNYAKSACSMYRDGEHSLVKADGSILVLLIDRLNVNDGSLKINNAELSVPARAEHRNLKAKECEKKCREDRNCIVFASPKLGNNCKLYQQLAISEDSIKVKGSEGEYFVKFQTNKTLT